MTVYTEVKNDEKVYYCLGPNGKKVYFELEHGRPLTGRKIPAGVYGRYIGPGTEKRSIPMMGLTERGTNRPVSQADKRVKRSQCPRTHYK